MSHIFVTLLISQTLSRSPVGRSVCVQMPKYISQPRIKRINSLMSLLSHGPVEKIILIKGLGYPNISAFEYDLAYLRKEFNADISYDRRTKSYCIKNDRGAPSGAVYTYKKNE